MKDPHLAVAEGLILLMAPVMITLSVTIHLTASPDDQPYTLIALGWMIASASGPERVVLRVARSCSAHARPASYPCPAIQVGLASYRRVVQERTRRLWEKQDQHGGDRFRLFAAVAESLDATRVLYPGSYVDLAPSFVWPSVTYVDVDRRAGQFFGDEIGVQELLVEHGVDPATRDVRFVEADYTHSLDLGDGEFDLLVSLYAGFVSEHCTEHLRVGGTLLANPSHGDVAMASIDPRYRLHAVVSSRSGRYSVNSSGLATYLVPKRDVAVTKESLHAAGRGVGYTKSPFAYLFERVA